MSAPTPYVEHLRAKIKNSYASSTRAMTHLRNTTMEYIETQYSSLICNQGHDCSIKPDAYPIMGYGTGDAITSHAVHLRELLTNYASKKPRNTSTGKGRTSSHIDPEARHHRFLERYCMERHTIDIRKPNHLHIHISHHLCQPIATATSKPQTVEINFPIAHN